MLFVAEYEISWDTLEVVVAKRLEWDDAKPDGFRFVGEYVWQDHDPPFRGVAIIDVEDVGALNAFVLHYGPALRMRVHPATDVASGISQLNGDPRPRPRTRRARVRSQPPKRRAKRA